MDLYDVWGGRLGVIKEEAEYQESSTMERARGSGTLQRITEDSTPSPTGADDGQEDAELLKEETSEVGTHKITLDCQLSLIFTGFSFK